MNKAFYQRLKKDIIDWERKHGTAIYSSEQLVLQQQIKEKWLTKTEN